MLQDALTMFMEDEGFTTNEASGAIDLYGAAIAEYPSSNLESVNARGKGTTLLIEGVIKRAGTGTTAFSGTADVTVYIDDTDGATNTVAVHTIYGTDSKHTGVPFSIAVPSSAEGRYLGIMVDDTSLVGGGDANVVDAWVFTL